MKRLHAGLAVAGLVGGAWFVGSALPSHASQLPTPNETQCLPPSAVPHAPSGSPVTASGVVMVIANQTVAGGSDSCTFTDTSGKVPLQYVAATPNAFTIVASHPGTVDPVTGVVSCSSGKVDGTNCDDASASGSAATDVQAGSPSPGDVTGSLSGAQTGDTVTVTVTYTCAAQDPSQTACGGAGTIAVGSPA